MAVSITNFNINDLNKISADQNNTSVFIDFLIVSKQGFKNPSASYLVSDFNNTSQQFKNFFAKYQKIMATASKNVLFDGKPLKLIMAEQKLKALEKKEGIKRYSTFEREKYLANLKEKTKTL